MRNYFLLATTFVTTIDLAIYSFFGFAQIPLMPIFPIICAASVIAVFALGFLIHNQSSQQQLPTRQRPDSGIVIKMKEEGRPRRISRRQSNTFDPLGPRLRSVPDLENDLLQPRSIRFDNQQRKQREERLAKQSTDEANFDLVSRESGDEYKPNSGNKLNRIEESLVRNIDSLSVSDLAQIIHRHTKALSDLITESKSRLMAVQSQMMDRMLSTSPEYTNSVVDVRRIIGALESRLDKLLEYSEDPRSALMIKARKLVKEELIIPCDAVNALISSQELPSLTPEQWEPTLDRLLTRAEQHLKKVSQEQNLKQKVQNL
jgi:hypothetical protein